MRPARIEVEGFSAFRSRVVVDLTRLLESDTAFFSLSGATGAGKSSLIDAMVFALYGRIPRLGAREVAPVISAGADRARVRLDFEADGDVYTAVREARRTKSGGATVKEARLQIGDKVVSDGAGSVTEAVEALLGLGFDDFTRTVVLPQGDFARFLHATPSERQNLLRGLLGLDVYSRVRTLAGERRAAAQARAETARARLDNIDVTGEDELQAMQDRLQVLQKLEVEAAAWESELAVLDKATAEAEAEVESLGDALTRLGALEPPPRLDDLAELVSEATTALHDATDAFDEAQGVRAALEQEAAELPEVAVLAAVRKARQEQQSVASRISELDPEPARLALEAAQNALAAAEAQVTQARSRLNESRMSHAAHSLASVLVAGAPCPVCRQEVGSVPDLEPLDETSRLEAEVVAADEQVVTARRTVDQARDASTRLEAERAALELRLAELASELVDAPDDKELERLESVVADNKARLVCARDAEEAARVAVESARKGHEGLVADQRDLGRVLRRAQQAVADLKPPITESDDVAVQWKELLLWRDETLTEVGGRIEDATLRERDARAQAQARQREIDEVLEANEVDSSDSVRAGIATAVERARHALEAASRAIAEVAELTGLEKEASADAAVAKSLADHLRADGFEKWMMGGALHNLVTGANGMLDELSDGGYSLQAADGAFVVADHRNADEIRPVSTLSGGETFLVSLALALSLAEIHASQGDARLEAVILDEGFGTLDEETLDTVASLLEELAGSRGLMVGVITHVKELAERASVRFEVVKGPTGAEVREVA